MYFTFLSRSSLWSNDLMCEIWWIMWTIEVAWPPVGYLNLRSASWGVVVVLLLLLLLLQSVSYLNLRSATEEPQLTDASNTVFQNCHLHIVVLLSHIFIVKIAHCKILKPREMVSRSALAYLHIRWNDLPFRLVQKISQKIWKQGKSIKEVVKL